MLSCVARKEFRSSYRLLSLRFDVLEFSEFFELDAHLEDVLASGAAITALFDSHSSQTRWPGPIF